MGRKRKDGKFVNCYLSSNLVDTLEIASDKTGKSKTRIIEDALTDHFVSQGLLKVEKDNSTAGWFGHNTPEDISPVPAVTTVPEISIPDDIGESSSDFSEIPAVFFTDSGPQECMILEELTIYGEPYYRIETREGVKKVHRSFVQKSPNIS